MKLSLFFLRHWSRHTPEGAKFEVEWNAKFVEYEKKYSEEAAKLKATITGELLAGWDASIKEKVSVVARNLCNDDFFVTYLCKNDERKKKKHNVAILDTKKVK